MSACDDCIHQWECVEQRGRCREFKSKEEIRKQIESINQKHKSSIPGRADKGGVQKAGSRRCVKVPKS